MTLTASSCLHFWDARYGSIPVIGGAPTFSRSSAGTWVDQTGIPQSAIVNTPRTIWASAYGESSVTPATLGNRRPALRLEQASTNLVIQSDALNTGWTLTSATATNAYVTRAGLSFSRLSSLISTSRAARSVTLTGDGVKALSFFVRTDGVAGSGYVALYDVTATANRCVVQFNISSSGVVTTTATGTGTVLAVEALAEGVYRILAASASCTAANAHEVWAYDGQGAATLTSVQITGVQVEDLPAPTSRIATTTGTATRAVDAFYHSYVPIPQSVIAYTRQIDRGSAALTTGPRIWEIGDLSAGTPQTMLHYVASGGYYRTALYDGATFIEATDASALATFGQTVEAVSMWDTSTGKVRQVTSLNGAAVSDSGWSASTVLTRAGFALPRLELLPTSHSGSNDFITVKMVKYADVVASTAQGIMDELRSFTLDSRQGVI